MAARLRKSHQDDVRPFYVYEFLSTAGEVIYVGKGSGNRLSVQCKAFGMEGYEVARFKSERHAYAFERERIAEMKPWLNVHPGGNGCTVKRTVKTNKTQFEKDCNRLGTRVVAARLLLRFAANIVDKSNLDELRRVAYG